MGINMDGVFISNRWNHRIPDAANCRTVWFVWIPRIIPLIIIVYSILCIRCKLQYSFSEAYIWRNSYLKATLSIVMVVIDPFCAAKSTWVPLSQFFQFLYIYTIEDLKRHVFILQRIGSRRVVTIWNIAPRRGAVLNLHRYKIERFVCLVK